MKSFKCLKLVIAVVLSILTPVLAAADSGMVADQDAAVLHASSGPAVMLEKSQSYVLDDYIKAFRTPVTNSRGEISYWDVTIKLAVDSNGKLKKTAKVTATKSPEIINGALVPGTYVAADGATCTVTNITLSNGRIQSFLTCKSERDEEFNLSVATGPLAAGHPFLPELTERKIDQRTDADTYTWGLLTGAHYTFDVGNCDLHQNYYNYTGAAVGAHTDGNVLVLSVFHASNNTFVCSGSLTKQE